MKVSAPKVGGDMLTILYFVGQLYLPPYEECTIEFMRDILSGKKQAFLNSQMKIIKVPNFAELTASKVYEMAINNGKINRYLPTFTFKRPLNREYLFNVSASS